MITGSEFYHILSAVVPLYATMILAYASVKWWKMFTQEQCAGINKFVAMFSIPLFAFDFMSSINFNDMNIRFILADSLQKAVVLILLFIWTAFTKKGSLEWSITLFSISTLPNTLVLGVPLCKSMYGEIANALMIQIVFFQFLIWNNLLLILYEYRATKVLISEQFPENVGSIEVDSDVLSLEGKETIESEAEVGEDGRVHVRLRKSASCNSRGYSSRTEIRCFESERMDLCLVGRSLSSSALADYRVSGGGGCGSGRICVVVPHSDLQVQRIQQHPKDNGQYKLGFRSRPNSNEPYELYENGPIEGPTISKARQMSTSPMCENEPKPKPTSKLPAIVMTKLILTMVWRKMIRNPNVYASVFGFIWSLISNKWHIKMPEIIAGSIQIVSKTGLGMAMFSLGLFMASQPKIIACGKTVATLTLAVRLVVGPLIMAGTSLIVGMRGVLLQVAIVQAALPQAIASFVFSKEYNLHTQILSTGVIFGMLISLPFTIVYYVLLGLTK